jgi:hypothetical protein
MALAQSERRYGGKIVEADDFVDQIFKDRVRPAPAISSMPDTMQRSPTVDFVPDRAREYDPVQTEHDAVDDRFKSMADLLLRKRSKAERWTTKSKTQAEQIFTLMTRFMKEERALENMSAVKQKDLAALASFLETEIYKHHGKSKNDKNRSISRNAHYCTLKA